MTSEADTTPATPGSPALPETSMDTVLRLEDENLQLKEAVRSHAVVDAGIGVILAVGQLTPAQGWDVLRSTSRTPTSSCGTWPN